MKRRNFIKLSATASAVTMLPTDVFALLKSAGMTSCPNVNERKIVLIQLAGANDGLNTIVPISQYQDYAALRPTIKLAQSGNNSIINLDSRLPDNQKVGLHPSLAAFKKLYENGNMRVIQGVGYPKQDRSHFKSTDLWFNGGDGTTANNDNSSGWMGRFIENYYADFLNADYPLGLQLGSSDNSSGFVTESGHDVAININDQSPSGFYNVVNGLGGPAPTNIPASEYGGLIQYILDNDSSVKTYSQAISAAFESGSNSLTYQNTNLSNQLKTVARFISGGLQTKVYLVKIDGFDTHTNQVASATSAHLGTHANLMLQVSQAIDSFIRDLNTQNLGDDVVAVTFSEFGRKAAQNGSLGTDHGAIAPMFVFGKSIQAGMSGTNVNLSEAVATNNFQLNTVQHDYRRVFSTIFQNWLGASNSTLDLTFYDNTNNSGFTTNKITDLIKAQSLIPESCYNHALLGNQQFEVKNEVNVFPNPTSEIITIHAQNSINSVEMYTIDGRLVQIYRNPLITNIYTINVQSFSVGLYNLKITTEGGSFSKKVLVRR